jgi:hypothetical protein
MGDLPRRRRPQVEWPALDAGDLARSWTAFALAAAVSGAIMLAIGVAVFGA